MNSTIYQGNIVLPGQYHNYNIAGNISNCFILGEIGSSDDFFLVGIEPNDESIFPSLTGNILDSEGNLLFQLRNNILKLNPGQCSKIIGNLIGYEIYDSAGVLIFKVETTYSDLPQLGMECFVTTLKANFYNKNGELIVKANSGETDEMITANTKTIFGYSNGSFGIVSDLNDEEIEFSRFVFGTGNATVEPLRGVIENRTIDLSGKVLIDATVNNCEVIVSSGEFSLIGKIGFNDCQFSFTGSAENLLKLYDSFMNRDQR